MNVLKTVYKVSPNATSLKDKRYFKGLVTFSTDDEEVAFFRCVFTLFVKFDMFT